MTQQMSHQNLSRVRARALHLPRPDFRLLLLLVLCLCSPWLLAQQGGRVEKIVVHSKALEGNLNGDSADREVYVYLPPGYDGDAGKRYPVVYLLHGYGLRAERWMSLFDIEAGANAAMQDGVPMIVVNPDAYNFFDGSMYGSSAATGDWETFIADELTAHIDANYRTFARRESRGLGGHSMGGYGALRIGMKRSDVFSALYPLAACCMLDRGEPGEQMALADTYKTRDDVAALRYPDKGTLARAAAWSPNPQRPPLYLDLPVENGVERPEIQAKWLANSILAMLDQYALSLRRYTAIQFDVGTQDGLIMANAQLDEAMTKADIPHTYVTYEGDHNNRIAERIEQHVLPFFGKHLKAD